MDFDIVKVSDGINKIQALLSTCCVDILLRYSFLLNSSSSSIIFAKLMGSRFLSELSGLCDGIDNGASPFAANIGYDEIICEK